MKKKIIGCPADIWAKRLFTVDRFEQISYFLGEQESEFLGKKVYPFAYLKRENLNDILVIINDSAKYSDIAAELEQHGLKENIHFFNGWKLDSAFYNQEYSNEKNWIEFEKRDEEALLKQREGWEKRARFLSDMIPNEVKSVFDIGCGECLLQQYLKQDVQYFGLDYCGRREGIFICDINQEPLPDVHADLYYMAGVIDYVENIPAFIKQFQKTKYVLLSKVRNERFIRLDARYIEEGYCNFGKMDYFLSHLINDMHDVGFSPENIQWRYKERDEYYILFKNMHMKHK